MKKHRIVTETELIFQWSREKSLPKHLSERVFFGLFPRRKRDTLTLSVIGTAYRRWDSLPTLDKVVVAPRALIADVAAYKNPSDEDRPMFAMKLCIARALKRMKFNRRERRTVWKALIPIGVPKNSGVQIFSETSCFSYVFIKGIPKILRDKK